MMQTKELTTGRIILNKVPAITLYFWVVKILCTTVGETAAGDLLAESLKLGYLLSAGIFAGLILIIWLAYKYLKLNPILTFWIAYILTRPLGASIGDYLSQAHSDGGLGLGTVVTSAIFLVTILSAVIYLTKTKKDLITL